MKARRDASVVARKVDEVEAAAAKGSNLLPAIIEAVKVRATLGEISARLAGQWGTYRPA